MIKNYILIQKLYDALLLSLLRAVKLSFILLCFSVSLNISSKSKMGIEFFSAAFSEGAAVSREQAAKAVWQIQIKDIGNATGFFISKNQIVTNFNVIQQAESIGLENIRLVQEGNPEKLKVKRIVRLSILEDLAVLEIEGAVSNFLSLPSKYLFNSSTGLYALGYPESKIQEINQTGVFIEDSFFGSHSNTEGASGSPVFNKSHQLEGVVFSIRDNLLSFINVEKLRFFIESDIFLCKSSNVKECFRSSKEVFKESMEKIKTPGDYFKIADAIARGLYTGEGEVLSLVIDLMLKAAIQNYAPALYVLGEKYYTAEGVERNLMKARRLIQLAAKRDYALAHYAEANMYRTGEGGEKNLIKARESMLKAAEQGFAPALDELAEMYSTGEGGEQDYFEERKWAARAALQGHVQGKRRLGLMYYYGAGGDKKPHIGIKWLKEAAEQDDVLAQQFLGVTYRHGGEGVKQDLFEARKWTAKAALQDDVLAQAQLGVMYYKGEGGGQDFFKGIKWLKEAAEKGNGMAQHVLGVMYSEGEGVEKNIFTAVKWLEEAVKKGNAEAKRDLDRIYPEYKEKKNYAQALYDEANMYRAGKGVKQNLIKARELMQKAAETGFPPAQDKLTEMNHNGEGVKQVSLKKENGFNRSALQDDAAATKRRLGLMYLLGEGVDKNQQLGIKLVKEAAAEGDVPAEYSLGLIYRDGEGVEQDFIEARRWMTKAALQDDVLAQVYLGEMYARGEGGGQDFFKAREWIEKAAKKDNPRAMQLLGLMYYEGKGGEKNISKAREWLEEAVKKGNAEAKKDLDRIYLEYKEKKDLIQTNKDCIKPFQN